MKFKLNFNFRVYDTKWLVTASPEIREHFENIHLGSLAERVMSDPFPNINFRMISLLLLIMLTISKRVSGGL